MIGNYIVKPQSSAPVRNKLGITPEQVKEWFTKDMEIHIDRKRISREDANYAFKEILNDSNCQDIFLKGKEVRAYQDSFAGFELVSKLHSLADIVEAYADEVSDCDRAELFATYNMNGFMVHIVGAYNDSENQLYITEDGGMGTRDREDTWDYGIVIDFTPIV
jgi:hypothetical protein